MSRKQYNHDHQEIHKTTPASIISSPKPLGLINVGRIRDRTTHNIALLRSPPNIDPHSNLKSQQVEPKPLTPIGLLSPTHRKLSTVRQSHQLSSTSLLYRSSPVGTIIKKTQLVTLSSNNINIQNDLMNHNQQPPKVNQLECRSSQPLSTYSSPNIENRDSNQQIQTTSPSSYINIAYPNFQVVGMIQRHQNTQNSQFTNPSQLVPNPPQFSPPQFSPLSSPTPIESTTQQFQLSPLHLTLSIVDQCYKSRLASPLSQRGENRSHQISPSHNSTPSRPQPNSSNIPIFPIASSILSLSSSTNSASLHHSPFQPRITSLGTVDVSNPVSDLNSEQHSFLFHQKQWNYDTDDDVDIDIDIDIDDIDDDDDDDANNVLFPQSPAKTPHRSPMLLSATPPPPITVSISQSRSSNKDTHQLIKTPPQNQFQHRLTPIERDFSLTSTSQKMHSQSQHSPQFSLSMNESEQFPPILITTPHHGYKFDPSTVVGSSLNRSNETNQFSSQSLTSTNPSSNYSNQQPSSGSLQLDRSNESINSILSIIDGAKSHNSPSVEVHHLGQNEFTPQDNTACSLQPPDISTTTNTAAVTMPYQYSTRSQINTTFQTSTTLYNAQVTKNSQFIPYHHIIPQIDLLIRNQPYSDHVEEEKSNQLKRLLCDLTRLELVKMCEGVKNIIPTDSIAQTILPQILSISDTILDSDNLISLYSFLHKLQTFPNNANYLPHGKEIVESNQKSVFEVNLQHWYNINQNTFERFLQDNQPAVNKTHLPTQTLQTNQPILLSIPNILQPSSSLRLGHVANPTQSLLSNSLLFRPNCSQTITDRSKNIIQQPRSRNGSIPTPQRPIPIVDVTALNPPPPQPSPPQPPPQPPLPIQHQEPISFPIIDIPPLSAQLLHSRRSTNSIPLFSTAAQIRDGSLPTPIHFEPPPTGLFTRDSTPIEFPSASPPQSITLPSTNLSANRTTRGLFTLNRRDRRSTNIPNNTENIYSSHHGTNISNNSHHYQRERSILYLVDDLKDDYYCSILDWGKNNIVALGLCNGIKLFNMNTVAVPYNHNGIPKSSSLRLPYSLFGPSLSSSQLQSSQRNNLRQYYSIIQGNIPLHFSNNPTLARLYYAEQNCLVYDSPHRNFERVLHHPTLFQPKHFSTRSIKKQAQLIHSSPFEITSLVWCNDNIIATGTKNGDIFLFDIEAEKLRQVYLKQHEGRIGSLSFCGSQNISNEEITSAHPTMQVDKYTIIEPNQQTEGDKEGGNYLKGGHRINSLGLINDEVWGQLSYNLENDNNNDDNENRNNNINTKQSAFSHIPSPQQVYINRHKQRQQAINANRMTTNTFQQSLQLLASGGRDGNIKLFDTRLPHSILSITDHHTQEVVGLKWSPNGLALASGSNDSTVGIWDVFGQTKKYRQHTAAIRALAWSPFQDYLLATGGGTQDKTICLWDVRYDYNHQARLHSSFSQYNLNNLPPAKGSLLSNIPSALVSQVHTGNQVCNLAWGKQYNELIVAFGFSQNMISFYDIPSLCPLNVIGDGHYVESRGILLEPTPRQYSVDTLLGTTPRKHHHVFTHRVNTSCQNNLTGFGSRPLHLVLSPTGHYLASAAGDKILRIVQIAK